jgi:hypothetical protein
LFSLSSFDIQGKVGFQDWTKDFCQVDNEGCLFDENSSSIAVALRGNCTFDVKASTAYKMGYKVHKSYFCITIFLTMVIAGPHRNQQRSKRRRSFSDGVF